MAGEKIGPAWQAIWDLLDGKSVHVSKVSITEMIISDGHMISPKTVGNLLGKATRCGLLECRHLKRGKPSFKRAYYRRMDMIPETEKAA